MLNNLKEDIKKLIEVNICHSKKDGKFCSTSNSGNNGIAKKAKLKFGDAITLTDRKGIFTIQGLDSKGNTVLNDNSSTKGKTFSISKQELYAKFKKKIVSVKDWKQK